jgi:ubiquinone/menaquinone biosynthesis C-methylase UbiE
MGDGIDPEILDHYGEGGERTRLSAGSGLLELLRTQELLTRYLPPPPAIILDVGGGPGVYAAWLAEQGYEVHLVDPVPLHVEQAQGAGAASATLGDARRLVWPDGSADGVLLLGPLYHLTERDDRIAALREGGRVLRPGGRLAAAAVSRFASTYDGLYRGRLHEPGFEEIVERDLRDGQHRNPTRDPAWFTTAYFHAPDELAAEIRDADLAFVALAAIEGPAWLVPDLDTRLADPAKRDDILRAIRRVETEPALLGASAHLLAVAER